MITKLTSDQYEWLETYSRKLCNIALSTEPANRYAAENGVKSVYELAGLEPPQEVIWFESPAALCSSPYVIQYEKSKVELLVYGEPIEQIRRQQEKLIGRDVKESIKHIMDTSARFTGAERVQTHIRQAVLSYLRNQNSHDVPIYIRSYRRYSIYGQHKACIQSQFGLLHASALLLDRYDQISVLDGIWQIIQNAGLWLPYRKVCLIAERTSNVQLDTFNNPHCEDGRSISYPDRFGIYTWHGIVVPEYIIAQPTLITPEKIMNEENVEIARIMVARYGQDNFIRDSGFKPIQSDDYGELYYVHINRGIEPIVAVHVKDPSTDREYFLYVPPHITTAHQGVAWTFGYDNVNDYNPDKET